MEYTSLFSPREYEKNDKIILKYFPTGSKKIKMKNIYCGKYRKINNSKISYNFEKILALSIICSKCGS